MLSSGKFINHDRRQGSQNTGVANIGDNSKYVGISDRPAPPRVKPALIQRTKSRMINKNTRPTGFVGIVGATNNNKQVIGDNKFSRLTNGIKAVKPKDIKSKTERLKLSNMRAGVSNVKGNDNEKEIKLKRYKYLLNVFKLKTISLKGVPQSLQIVEMKNKIINDKSKVMKNMSSGEKTAFEKAIINIETSGTKEIAREFLNEYIAEYLSNIAIPLKDSNISFSDKSVFEKLREELPLYGFQANTVINFLYNSPINVNDVLDWLQSVGVDGNRSNNEYNNIIRYYLDYLSYGSKSSFLETPILESFHIKEFVALLEKNINVDVDTTKIVRFIPNKMDLMNVDNVKLANKEIAKSFTEDEDITYVMVLLTDYITEQILQGTIKYKDGSDADSDNEVILDNGFDLDSGNDSALEVSTDSDVEGKNDDASNSSDIDFDELEALLSPNFRRIPDVSEKEIQEFEDEFKLDDLDFGTNDTKIKGKGLKTKLRPSRFKRIH